MDVVKRDVWGQARGGAGLGQWILSMGPPWDKVRILIKRTTTPSKKAFKYFINYTKNALNIVYVP
jgi:hypothetical protein